MALRVIGSGFGRTGTMSMKLALEQLGLGPCHHMIEVIRNPEQPSHWKGISDGVAVDWTEVFRGYTTQVDWPGAAVWRETAVAFPDAKVVHTERPEDEWWNSFSVTIAKFFARAATMELPAHVADIFKTMDKLIVRGVFGGPVERDSAIAAYRRNNQEVRESIPNDRLLVFNIGDGWAPLCRFLEVAEPATPFPRSNARDEFWTHFGGEPA